MPERPWADEYTVLCERCGYVVEGLDPAGACPECGKPIAESLPERRVGTPWQRARSARNWIRTAQRTLTRPNRTLAELEIEPHRSGQLRTLYILTAAMLLALAIRPLFFYCPARPGSNTWVAKTAFLEWRLWVLVGAVGVGIALALFILTWIEQRGLIFFGNRRHLRCTPAIAKSVCAHGAVGWVIAGVMSVLAVGSVFLYQFTWGYLDGTSTVREWAQDRVRSYAIAGLVIGILPGFLFFETFAYLGLRRCKFANRQKPGAGASG